MQILSFLFLLQLIKLNYPLYFLIGETERKCFIEDISDEMKVTVKYKVQLNDLIINGLEDSSPEIGMHIEIRNPQDKIKLSKGRDKNRLIRKNKNYWVVGS